MKRVYHHYEKWEEIKSGMWRNVPVGERQQYVDQAASLMKDANAFFLAMQRATIEWPHSCEHHLTGTFNRQAWMGHAGCCIAVNSPEDLTRLAWHTLTQDEQDRANRAADRAIAEWERKHLALEAPCQNED
jgi:hypothetical protein